MRVLIVEDEHELAAVIARVLDRSGFAVDVASTTAEALRLQTARDYDVLVLDRTLPDGSGDELCRRVVGSGASAKVLMLTARDAVAERVAGLEELLRVEGAVVSTDRLLNAAWGDAHAFPFDNTVRVTIMRLRRKLGPPPVIETVVGEGYRLT
jgi:DNA-binding response OmpR family regulator